MKLRDIRGLKYPDEFVIKFFFKNGLQNKAGSVLELGCGNGNNLLLFHEYGWSVEGIDIDRQALDDAEHNFALTDNNGGSFQFVECDLSKGIRSAIGGSYEVIMLPSSIYYISRDAAINVLKDLGSVIKNDSLIFVRARGVRDYRYRRGPEVERNSFRLDISETGELDTTITFYHEYELVDLVRQFTGLDTATMQLMNVAFDNIQNGTIVHNHDIVLWGRLRKP